MTSVASADGVGMAGAPTQVVAAGINGDWVVMCQARKDTDKSGGLNVRNGFNSTMGDDQHAYLVVGTGLGQQIDDFFAADPTRRRALILRKKRVVLIQPGLGKDIDVSALSGDGPIEFDESGDHLIFARKRAGKTTIVIHAIDSGKENFLDPGSGKLVSLYTHPGDSWMEIQVFANRKGDLPYKTTEGPSHGWCWTGAVSDSSVTTGTPPVTRYLSVDGKSPARELADVVGIGGDQLFRRAADGAITTERPGEQPRTIVPAACGGRAVGMHDGALVVACTKRGAPSPLEEYAADGTLRKINATITASDSDSTHDLGRFLFVTGRDANDTIIYLVTGKTHQSPEYQQTISHEGDSSLVQRGEHLVVIEPSGDRTLGSIAQYPSTFDAGTFTYVEPLVIDRTGYTLIGTAPTHPSNDAWHGKYEGTITAVAKDGRVLVGWGPEHGRWAWVSGPLEWITPVTSAP
ncbi:MAG TPA: hypothetical protein VGM90_05200 [Kofleriaceae bacterium]